MATLEDILAATKILAENSAGNQNGGSCAITEENRNWVSDLKKDDGTAADIAKRIVEGETVVKSIVDGNSCVGKTAKEKVAVGDLISLSTGGRSDSKNKADVEVGAMRDEKIADGKNSWVHNGQSRDSDGNKLDVTERKSSYAGVDECEKGQLNGEKMEDLDHGFCTGDFVWGKIKSHPWWPGQIYDSRDASDFAMKRRQDGHLLVAFFGDGSCSWCSPSQLKPFVENFKEMSVGSAAKSFVNAVQRAVDEIGRLVESKMTCGCVPLEKRDGLAKPQVTNAGIKVGVLAPDSQLSVPEYDPAGILERVTELANAVYVDNVFELAVLRSWLSAFHRAKGFYPLPEYCEPFHIEGMEDKNKIVSEVTDDFSVPIEVPILGPLDDDWLSFPVCNNTKSQGSSGEKTYHRRKQKSVAELMGESPNDKSRNQEETTTKERKDAGKSTSSKKKQMRNDGKVEEVGTGGNSSEETTTKERKEVGKSTSFKKKQKKNDEKVEEVGTGGNSLEETTTKEIKEVGKSTSSKKQKKRNGGEVEVGTGGDSVQETTTKERKEVGKSTSSKKKQKKRNEGELEAGTGRDSSQETTTKERKEVGKSTSSKKKPNKINDGKVEEVGTQGDSSEETITKERRDVRKSTSSKKKKKKNIDGKLEEVGPQGDSLEETTVEGRKDVWKSTASRKKKKKKISHREVEEVGTKGDLSTGKLGRKRKLEASEMPKLVTKIVPNSENSGSGDDISEGTSSGKSKKIEVATENTSGETKEDTETVSTPRERKKSKYLCPPYTTPSWRMGSSSFKMGTPSDKSPKVDNMGEHVTEAAAEPCASESASEFADKLSGKKVTESHQEGLDASIKESLQTEENNQKTTIAASDVSVPVDDLVSNIQCAAVDPFYLSKEGCLDMVWSFVSALRSSVYLHGPNYRVYQKCKTGNKRKSSVTKQGIQENDASLEKVKLTEKSMPQEKKTQKKPDQSKSKSKSKKATEILDGNASSRLVLKFRPEYPLPSKEEIVRLYSKYGSLNERETHVATDSHSVHVVYTEDTDAEAAFKSPMNERPFGHKKVNYSLRQSLRGSKSRASHPKVTPRKRAAEERPDSSQPTPDNDLLTDVRVIKQKLDIMTVILENYHSKFSAEDKSGLKHEMKNLLENVETASEKVQVLAEKSPA